MVRTFVVARNPDAGSALRYLIRLPIGRDGLVLKAREPWPRTAAVYCHPADAWPQDAAVLEEVPVRSCVRRGRAIDLVLDRARENRSQIVYATTKAGREVIFWQTARTVRRRRPGARLPTRRASGIGTLAILVDTRERYPYRFAKLPAATERRPLPAGDYGVEHDGRLVAAVERKSAPDLAKALVDGSLAFLLADLAALPHAGVVVEDPYAALFKLEHVEPGWLPELLARVQVRYPGVPIAFCETRPLAEQWTYRFLGAALAEATGEARYAENAPEAGAGEAAEEAPPYPPW